MRLAEQQRLFWSLATRHAENGNPLLSKTFGGSSALDAESRMEIYANMFIWRQIDALREDFPKLAKLMGDQAFYAFAEAYLGAYPSEHHSLSKLGRKMPTFLKEQAQDRADLADLADLEWARAEVFEEAACTPAMPRVLRKMAMADFANQSLVVVPALRLLRLDHDVLRLWKELEAGQSPSKPSQEATAVVVWRKKFEIFHVRVELEEAQALHRVMIGEPLGIVCEAFEHKPEPVHAAFEAIRSWFVEGWIAQPAGKNSKPRPNFQTP